MQVSCKSFISLCHSMNGDFCGHSRFVLWHENLTTFVSWTLAKSESGGGSAIISEFDVQKTIDRFEYQ